MELWIVLAFGIIAASVFVLSIYKGKKTKNKKWYVLAGLMVLYIVVCGLYGLLDSVITK